MRHYYLLDLDRCLLNTEALHMVFDEIVRSMSIFDVNDIINAKKIVEERSGGSFDTAEYIQTELQRLGREDRWQDIEANFLVASKNYNYLLPGAAELLSTLDSLQYPYGIITFGGQVWQAVKIKAAELDAIPHLITSEKQKGYQVAEWVQAGQVPTVLGGTPFDEIVMVDDKVASFTGFPRQAARGYQVRTGKDLQVHPDTLPANVSSVESLYDVIAELPTQSATRSIDKLS